MNKKVKELNVPLVVGRGKAINEVRSCILRLSEKRIRKMDKMKARTGEWDYEGFGYTDALIQAQVAMDKLFDSLYVPDAIKIVKMNARKKK